MSDDEVKYPTIHVVEWVDITNIAEWTDIDEIDEWAKDGGFVCRNVGYLMYEDDDSVVLGARIALRATPEQVGLYERIPKGVIKARWELHTQESGT